jgi:predicted alpha/beta-hydrolase family hydrolase
MVEVTEFTDATQEPAIRGFLHAPAMPSGNTLVLTHGAGADCRSKLMVAAADALAESGLLVLRCDLPFRQIRPHGPPSPGSAARDRQGLWRAVEVLQKKTTGRIFLGGHSYGGRQATMLVAEEPELAAGLLLLSYPLHPPRRPTTLRTAHFSNLTTPALFVHGSRDPFGSLEEMTSALQLIPAPAQLLPIEGGGHELLRANTSDQFKSALAGAFRNFFGA